MHEITNKKLYDLLKTNFHLEDWDEWNEKIQAIQRREESDPNRNQNYPARIRKLLHRSSLEEGEGNVSKVIWKSKEETTTDRENRGREERRGSKATEEKATKSL